MARRGEPADLDAVEPLADDASPPQSLTGSSEPSSARRRRWPWVAVAVVTLIVAAVVFPIRVRLAEAASERLDRRWFEATAIDNGRNTLEERLHASALDTDAPRVDAALGSLDRELARRFDDLRHRIAGERVVDGGVQQLARAERRALADAADRARRHQSTLLDASGEVQRQLARERNRWHRQPAHPRTLPGGLHAADATLNALQRWTDEPTGAILAIPLNDHIDLLDVDRAATTTLDPHAAFAGARRGWMAVVAGKTAWALPLTGTTTGPPVQLGQADQVWPALRDDAVWLESYATAPPTCTEVDGSGHVIATVRAHVIGETTAGLVVYLGDGDAPSGVAIQHLDGSPGPAIPMPVGAPFSIGRSAVAWLDVTTPRPYPAAIWSAATGESRTIAPPAGFSAVLTGRFTPDSARLAVLLGPDTPGSSVQPAVVDVASGDVHVLPPPAGNAQGGLLAWSPDGRLLFFYAFGARHPFTVYRPDSDGPALTLRAHDVSLGEGGFIALQP